MADMKDFLKKRKEQKATEGAAAPVQKPKQELTKIEYRCGHKRNVVEVRNNLCPECQRRGRTQANARKHAARRARQPQEYPHRWPAGTSVSKSWDGTAWRCVVNLPADVGRFEAEANGSFAAEKLCWEQWLKENEQ